ncbi:MAG TPA: helix-hairpin-helix domain-containing protein [Rhabdochlamydiaceae bacterium]|jgi:hypothetical protein
MRNLSDLRNAGKATLADLALLGIDSVEELARQNATCLFHELERRTQQRQDPCVWDVFAAIIHEAVTGEASNCWRWTDRRKVLQKSGRLDHII